MGKEGTEENPLNYESVSGKSCVKYQEPRLHLPHSFPVTAMAKSHKPVVQNNTSLPRVLESTSLLQSRCLRESHVSPATLGEESFFAFPAMVASGTSPICP